MASPLLVETSAVMDVAVVAVILRFWSRAVVTKTHHNLRPRFWWDDWLVLATLPFLITYHALGLRWIQVGLGKHIVELGPEGVKEGIFFLIMGTTFYNVSISLPKLSTVFFYDRVFATSDSKTMKRVLWSVGVLVVLWCFTATMTNLMQCVPIEKSWEPEIPGTCITNLTWWLPFGISSALIDLILLVIPLPCLWRLQMPLKQKALLTFVFISGCSVIVISIGTIFARLEVAPILRQDLTYNFLTVAYWSGAEDALSVFSVCLPAIFTLVKRGVEHGPKSLLIRTSAIETSESSKKSISVKSIPRRPPLVIVHKTMSHDSIENLRGSYAVEAAACHNPSMDFEKFDYDSMQMESIKVKKEFDVTYE